MKRNQIMWGLVGLFLLLQVFRIDTSLPASDPAQDFLSVSGADANTASIIQKACYDCHSNQTEYPWYSHIAPLSWWIQNHIIEGREHLNFSTWGGYSKEDQQKIKEECTEVIQEGEMPMASFTWAHPEARLSDEQKAALVGFFGRMNGESE
jgi:hypothetical protein